MSGVVVDESVMEENEVFVRQLEEGELKDNHDAVVEHMKEVVAEAGICIKDVSQQTLRRFLVARTLHAEKAAHLYINHRKWRESYIPDGGKGRIPMEDVTTMLKQEVTFLHTAPGCTPLLVLHIKNYDAVHRHIEDVSKFCVYAMETAIACMPANEYKFRVILDFGEATHKNMDGRGSIAFLSVLQAHFPERLRRLYILHASYLAWATWNMIWPFIDGYTRKKVRFIEDKNVTEILPLEIDPKVLPTMYGGEAKLTHLREAKPTRWPTPTE